MPVGPHSRFTTSRRDFLQHAGAGFGALAFAGLHAHATPLGKPHHRVHAKSVIWCFLDGGPSHIDLFDPKPALKKYHGQPLPASFPRPVTAMGTTSGNPLMASTRQFRRHGQCGHWVSDLYPEIAGIADRLCLLQGCVADGLTHVQSVLQMNTCGLIPGRPCLGSWAVYGLGAETENLPGFVVLADSESEPPGGSMTYGNGFLPNSFAGTRFSSGQTPILHTGRPAGVSETRQRAKFDFIRQMNEQYSHREPAESQIAAAELAFRMQSSAPEVVDLSRETTATHRLYGTDRPETERNARNCLLARRLVERGVRFVQLYMGTGSEWDAHKDLNGNHATLCRASDRPIAGLIRDLAQRGMLNDTLVVWGGEFGRTPMSESGDGRDHNPYGFTVWFAGGGVKPGHVHGATDELGLYAIDGQMHVKDLHATILHLMGVDHEALTFRHNGRDEIVTGIGGKPVTSILK